MNIHILDKNKMRAASQLVVLILNEVEKIIKPGINTLDIDILCQQLITKYNAVSGSLGYYGFPKSVCTSINNVICHGIPKAEDILKNGDFVNVDLALSLDGYFGDHSRCFLVGTVNKEIKLLVERTYEAMWQAIGICKNNLPVRKIGEIVEKYIKPYKYGVVEDFCGHAIGHNMHEQPDIPYIFDKNNIHILKTGMCITIEPLINAGSAEVKILDDGWTAVTQDGSMSSQWEHTIYINNDGCEVLSFNEFDKKNNKLPIIKI
jgi:methionyl aminopeptidase